MSLVEAGYAEAARLVRRRARNFYFAFLGQRPPARRALHVIYAFCREADDAVDDGRPAEEARQALMALSSRLGPIYEGRPERARDLALQDAVRSFGIERRDFESLLSGVARDLDAPRYATFDDLFGYCYGVAASVGLLCLPVFGRHDALARRHAVDLGIGMQLTNILRDLGEDGARGRLYLPRADMRRFGIVEGELLDLAWRAREGSRHTMARESAPGATVPRPDGRLDRLVRFEAARARRFMTSGLRLLPLLEPRERFCPWMLAAMYGEVLEGVEKLGGGVLGRRVALSSARKLWLVARGMVGGNGGARRRA
ncbi:MAG TPA: squalene/phytoene synthase family protein [Gemmatimonadota bacterium]|jgi:phytoene synthase